MEKAAVERATRREELQRIAAEDPNLDSVTDAEDFRRELAELEGRLDAGEDYETTIRRNAVTPVAPGFKAAK